MGYRLMKTAGNLFRYISAHRDIFLIKILYILGMCFVLFPINSGLAWQTKQTLIDSGFNREVIPICAIQGDYFYSDYAGQIVRTQGVVYADLDITSRAGFFIQVEDCDNDPATSDGIFVNLGVEQDVVSVGDSVDIQGVVLENYGNTEIDVITGTVTVVSSGVELPTPFPLNPPTDNNTSRWYFESLENMSVSLNDAITVGPTDSFGSTWVVRTDLGIQRVFQDNPGGTGEVVCIGDRGLFEITPEATVGDRLLNLYGALKYSYGDYCLQLTSQPVFITSTLSHNTMPLLDLSSQNTITLASLNLHNFFDTVNDPQTDDTVISYPTYVRRLQKRAMLIHDVLGEPDLLAVQEVENDTVLDDLVASDEIMADYETLLVNGPDLRGQDVALLYRSDRVEIMETQVYQGCTTLVDGLGVDGNQDVYNPANALTCDTDGDSILDGNRLFSRPPLRVRVKVYISGTSGRNNSEDWVELTLVINHFKSKFEDSPTTAYTLPRRIQEAQFVANLIQELRAAYPDISLFVLGDLNDYPDSQPLALLKAVGLQDLSLKIPHDERFSYNYHGVSQVLDYVLYFPALGLGPTDIQALHVNADYPYELQNIPDTYYRSSDHDPLLVTLTFTPHKAYFPLGIRNFVPLE